MRFLKSRLFIALLTFGIGILGAFIWYYSSHRTTEKTIVYKLDKPLHAYDDIVNGKNGSYVTVIGFIDEKSSCQAEAEKQLISCQVPLTNREVEEKSVSINIRFCNELVKTNCLDWAQTKSANETQLYDKNSNLIDSQRPIKVTGTVSVIDGQGFIASPVSRLESVDRSNKPIVSLSKINLAKIGHFVPGGRVQDININELKTVDDLIANGKNSVPYLINKLTDETKVEGQPIDLWGDVRVGDISFIILTDFFTDTTWKHSTIDGASFDDFLGCHNSKISSNQCLYDYIDKHGRKDIKAKWQKIWEANKDKIYWDEAERCFKVN